MSAVYDKVVKALRSAAAQQGTRRIMINPDDLEALKAELGVGEGYAEKTGLPTGSQIWTPGSWLLQVPIGTDEKLPPGEVVLEVKTWEWM